MRLVAESSGQSDINDGRIGSDKLVVGVLHSQFSNVLADGMTIISAESARQLNRMGTNF
jgi:hypothetical protein